MVGYSERCTTLCATASEDFAAIFGSHSLAETVLIDSSAVGGLKSSFHRYFTLIKDTTMPRVWLKVGIRNAKLVINFINAKFSRSNFFY